MNWKNLSLKMKLVSGFSIMIVLLLGVSLIGFWSLDHASKGFTEYREMARDTNLAGRVQANMLMVRMNVKNYLISGTQESLNEFHKRWEMMMKFQSQAQSEIQNPERAKKIDTIETGLADYQKGFDQVVDHQRVRNQMGAALLKHMKAMVIKGVQGC
nr:MCP four helix bundle domain-containing protein [uncultured Desulfobacter sp.]